MCNKRDFICKSHQQRTTLICTCSDCPYKNQLCCKLCKIQVHQDHPKKVVPYEQYKSGLRFFVMQKIQRIPECDKLIANIPHKLSLFKHFLFRTRQEMGVLQNLYDNLNETSKYFDSQRQKIRKLAQLQPLLNSPKSQQQLKEALTVLTSNLNYCTQNYKFQFPQAQKSELANQITLNAKLLEAIGQSELRCEQYVGKILDVIVTQEFQPQDGQFQEEQEFFIKAKQTKQQSCQTQDLFQSIAGTFALSESRYRKRIVQLEEELELNQRETVKYMRKVRQLKNKTVVITKKLTFEIRPAFDINLGLEGSCKNGRKADRDNHPTVKKYERALTYT